jgi:hypothetical protein
LDCADHFFDFAKVKKMQEIVNGYSHQQQGNRIRLFPMAHEMLELCVVLTVTGFEKVSVGSETQRGNTALNI